MAADRGLLPKAVASYIKGGRGGPVLPPALGQKAMETLLTRLGEGGYNLYFRHAHRAKFKTVDAFDLAGALLSRELVHPTFTSGRCLSEQGMAESWLLNQVFAELDIPIGKVVSSPVCRCYETALHAFGRVDQVEPDLVYTRLKANYDAARHNESLHRILGAQPAPGMNTVLVAHKTTLNDSDFWINLQEPDALVFKPGEDGPEFVGRVTLEGWVKLLERRPLQPFEMPSLYGASATGAETSSEPSPALQE